MSRVHVCVLGILFVVGCGSVSTSGDDDDDISIDAAVADPDAGLARRTLSVTRTGTGTGTVVSAPVGIDCGADCTEEYAAGTEVTLTATAGGSGTFAGWSGGGCTGTGSCVVDLDADTTVSAQFTAGNVMLTVSLAGDGTGGVTSSPGGIDCGNDCSEAYAPSTLVTLTATPTGTSTFVGWGGACTGNAGCSVTLTQASLVTATFEVQCIVDTTFSFTGAPQTFVVPSSCTQLRFTAAGAQGGTAFTAGGLGAQVTGTFAVTPAAAMTIFVGEQPTGNGGGGGTFVVAPGNALVIAAGGGGGGAGDCCGGQAPGFPGVSSTSGTAGQTVTCAGGAGGAGGLGGLAGDPANYASGGGAGFSGDGQDGVNNSGGPPGLGGRSLAGGFAGGGGFTLGGYGGGGGSSNYGNPVQYPHGAGGGGGGYSGGGGTCGSSQWGAGGGGGSFNPGANAVNLDGVQAGSGFVRIVSL